MNAEFASARAFCQEAAAKRSVTVAEVTQFHARDTQPARAAGLRDHADARPIPADTADLIARLEAAEVALLEADARHRALIEALGVAVYTTDAEGRLTFYNEAAAALWGWRPALGQARWCGSWKIYCPDGTPLAHEDCPMGVAIREGRVVRGVEAIAERPDGSRVPFIPYPTPLRDDRGRLIGAVNVLVDITERKAAEAALKAREAELRALVETTPECIKVVAPDGTLLQMNHAGLCMIEADAAEEALGLCVFDLIAPEHRDVWRANHERVCQGDAVTWEFDIISLRGVRRRMETHATPLRLSDGRSGHLAITRDITERKAAEERQKLLIREVDHRAKNALAVVQSMLRLSDVENVEDYLQSVQGRIDALARAQTLLADQHWEGADLYSLLQAELVPFLSGGGKPRADLLGPKVSLPAEATQPLAMAVHELATNAVKHGALSTAEGRVAVSWELDGGGHHETLRLRWAEIGGPRLRGTPARHGFGSSVIEGTVVAQLRGRVAHLWHEAGLVCDIEVPLSGPNALE